MLNEIRRAHLLRPSIGAVPPAFVGIHTMTTTTAGAVSNVPTGTVNGDFLLFISTMQGSGEFALPTGFTSLTGFPFINASAELHLGYRVANSEPASYTPGAGTTATQRSTSLVAYRNASSASLAAANNPSDGQNVVAPSINTPGAGILLCLFTGWNNFGDTYVGVPTGMTERARTTYYDPLTVAELAITVAGATGTKTGTSNFSQAGTIGASLFLS